MMKKMISLLLALTLLLSLLSACQQPAAESDPPTAEPTAEISCAEVMAGVLQTLGIELGNVEVYSVHENDHPEQLTTYLEEAYELAEGEWEDAYIVRETGASAVEMVVLRFVSEDAAKCGEDSLRDYLHGREGDFTGYAPAQAKLVADAALVREGRYLGLFIVEDSDEAGRAFAEIVKTGEIPEPIPTPTPSPEPAAFTPAFAIHDLLHCVLLEAACPDWPSRPEKSWTDGRNGWLYEIEYGITSDQYQDCAIGKWGPESFYTVGDSGSVTHSRYQVAVFQADSEEGAAELVQKFHNYVAGFAELFQAEHEDPELSSVSEEDMAAMEGAVTVQAGHYAALIVSEHAAEAVQIFPRAVNSPNTKGYFERYISGSRPIGTPDPNYPGRFLFTPPNEEDMSIYDTSAIRAAWEKADPAGLSDADRAVYDAAQEILDDILQEGMTGLEKEHAVYDWLVNNVNYDWRHQDIMAETPRTSYQPYGGLVDRTAVCLGYAASFQLLMDLAGVECITVVGACFNSEGDHAWNMVRLDGSWYCVDVTWDANGRESLGDSYEWQYFNITSDEMAKNHQWDYASTPEATESLG